jgi:hypothetical protein
MTLGGLLKLALAGIASSRIYPGLAPEGLTGEYLTYQHEGPPNATALSGLATLRNQIVQIDSWADTYVAAETNGQLIVDAMTSQSAEVGSPALFSAELVNYGYFGPDPDTGKERVSMEFSVWYYP